jgi:branched-chain amino acid transport system ATP-binding protein
MTLLLEVRDYSVAYGPIAALDKVSISVGRGEIVAVLGANGAGKSTLLNSLVKAVACQASGSVELEGRSLAGLHTRDLVKLGVVLVPEGRQLFADLTVAENLRIGAYLRSNRSDVEQDFEHVLKMFPVLRERRNQTAATLSGGEQQMVAIGRAMMARPRLLFLDEPSLGLSPVLVSVIMRMIREINAMGVTVILVEQNVRQALKIASHAIVLAKGRVVTRGSAAELAKEGRLAAAYLGAA